MTEQLSNKDELGSSFPVTRRALINGYVVAAIVLLLVPCTSFIEALVNASTPTIHLDPIPFALLFAALICAGICCGNRARSKTLRIAGLFVACTTTAYCLSALAVTTFVGWLDFTDRVNDLDDLHVFVGRSIAGFFEKHPPQQAFGLGLWSLLTPVALLLFVILLATLARRFLAKGDLAERLAITIILAAVGSSAFLLGSMLTSERFPRSEVEVGNLVFPIAPKVMLGALSAWSYVNLRATVAPKRNSRSARSAVDVEKVLSQVSQISIIILVLLYLGISQTSGYAHRLSELIRARQAFAVDVLKEQIKDDSVWSITHFEDGKTIGKSFTVQAPWATIEVGEYAADKGRRRVEVKETLTGEEWTVRVHQNSLYGSTKEVADREGVRYDGSEGPIKIYPRIETELRSKEVAFPGTGLSLNLSSFTLLVPFIVFAALVLLQYRARTALTYYSRTKIPLIILHARRGLAGTLARLWLSAIAIGPYLLSILVVQAVALTLRARGGTVNTLSLDAIATGYVLAVLVMLITSTRSAVKTLLALRSTALQLFL